MTNAIEREQQTVHGSQPDTSFAASPPAPCSHARSSVNNVRQSLSIKRSIQISCMLLALYPCAFYTLMYRTPAYNPGTTHAEYPSSFKWTGPAIKGLGGLFPSTHWTNKVFTPLDWLLRHDDLRDIARIDRWMDSHGRCYYDTANQAEPNAAPGRH